MLDVSNVSLRFGKRVLFEDINLKFFPGNCYGVIGANGAGKSTFLKILAGDIEANTGSVSMAPGARMAVLRQNHFEFDQIPVLQTVIMGHKRLYEVMTEKDAIYMKEEFTEEDGIRSGHLEEEFAEMDGWNAESDAASLLSNLGIGEELHSRLMHELNGNQKVRVLLAQALFGNPDILLLDEPTNDLDAETIIWLEDFLADFDNVVIVVSHDRHFLDTVCTHIADVDFGKINIYTGNYSFWYQASQLAARQRSDQNKKVEDKRKELQDFVARFSANASKSRQATSRKKLLDKLVIDEIQPSNRKYPAIMFKMEREPGNQLITVENLAKSIEGRPLFRNVTFSVDRNDKIALLSRDSLAVTMFFRVLAGEVQADKGEYRWGQTITTAYLPNENNEYFQVDLNLVDWLRQYSTEKDETFIRTFLGRMLFTGEETQKKANVLSGGEKVRCMLSRMMLQAPNFLLLDEPTNHLDLESITAFNNALIDFKGALIMTSHDFEFSNTVANRIIEIGPNGILDKRIPYEEYMRDENLKAQRDALYAVPVK